MPTNTLRRAAAPALITLLAGTLIGAGVLISGALSGPPGAPEAHARFSSADAALALAADHLRAGAPLEAVSVLDRATRQFPSDQRAHTNLAQALVLLDRPAEALPHYQRALLIGPDTAPLRFEAGTVANTAGNRASAVEHYKVATTLDQSNPQYPLFLGMVQLQLGDRPQATINLLRAIRLDPAIAEAWGTLAQMSLDENRVQSALEQARTARQLQPDVPRWRVLQARILRRDNRPEEAIELLQGLPQTQLLTGEALRTLAECHAMTGDTPAAAALYLRAAEAHPTDGPLLLEAAQWASRAGNRDDADRLARSALDAGQPKARALLQPLSEPQTSPPPAQPPAPAPSGATPPGTTPAETTPTQAATGAPRSAAAAHR